MSGSHDKLPKLFWIQIILVLIVGTLYLLAPSPKKAHKDNKEDNSHTQAAASNLKPVGKVAMQGETNSTSASKARSGQDIYNKTCQTCHATGIANAPKLDDKAAWEARAAQGLDTLLKTASTGKGAMPPKGGDPTLTEEELKAAILFMTHKAGIQLDPAKKPVPHSVAKETQKDSHKTSPSATTPTAPKQAHPVNSIANNAPPSPVINKEAKTTPPAAPSAPPPPNAPKAETTVSVAAASPPNVVVTPPPVSQQSDENPASTASLEKGKTIYKSACFACHDTGVAGAPKITDKASWAPRIATGKEALYNSALHGKGVMPPKGGNITLSDEDIKATVDYIIATVQ